jgi:hypothetical protein
VRPVEREKCDKVCLPAVRYDKKASQYNMFCILHNIFVIMNKIA